MKNITKQLQTQILDSSQQEYLMFTQPRDPNVKNKPGSKTYCYYCHGTNHSISACFKKQRNDEDKTDAYARAKSPEKSLYKTFVLPQTTEKNMILVIEAKVHHEKFNLPKITIHKTDIVLRLEIDSVMTRKLLIHNTLDHDKTIINETPDLIALLIDPFTNHLILVNDIDHAQIQEITTILQVTHLHSDHLQDQEILGFQGLAHTQIQVKTIQRQVQKAPIYFEVHMYPPTEMANAAAPTSWFCFLYIQTSSNQSQRDYPSRLENTFLMDSAASTSVLKHPTFGTIAKLLYIKQNNTVSSSKASTVANQTEVSILLIVTITISTTIEDDSRQFTIPFAVADIRYKILIHPSLKKLYKT